MADTQYLEDDLKLRVEDPDGIAFGVGDYESVLNYATQQAIDMLNPIHLSNCAVLVNATATSGVLLFSQLLIDNAKQILSIIDKGSGAEFELTHQSIDIINHTDYKRFRNNKYYEGTENYPVAYPSPSTAQNTAGLLINPSNSYELYVTVIQNPSGMGTDSALYDIPSSVKDIVLDFAESRIWRIDNKQDRSQVAYKSAIERVNLLNGQVANA